MSYFDHTLWRQRAGWLVKWKACLRTRLCDYLNLYSGIRERKSMETSSQNIRSSTWAAHLVLCEWDAGQITIWLRGYSIFFNPLKATRNCMYIPPGFCHSETYFTPTEHIYVFHVILTGVRGGAVGWGAVLQAERSRVWFPILSLEFFIGIILPAALLPWGWLSL
jgi:hypothetical protein